MSAALRLMSLLLYQTAIELSPLSVTVPYLSFTPAMLLVTAFLLIGEQPSLPGLAGVLVVTAGGYLLAFSSASGAKEGGKKRDLPELPRTSSGAHQSPRVSDTNPAVGGDGSDSLGSLEMGSKLLLLPDAGRNGFKGAMV
jgi:hypothetical protein